MGRMFEAHGAMAFALCKLLLRNTQDAEDATQQVFLSAYRSMLQTVPEDPAPWLAAIARNECLTRLRRKRPETVALREADHPRTTDTADLVGRRDEIAALSEAIAGLPPAQRQAVILRDFYGLSYREVSVALGVSGPAVESLLFKGRKRLRERLPPHPRGQRPSDGSTRRAGSSRARDPRLLGWPHRNGRRRRRGRDHRKDPLGSGGREDRRARARRRARHRHAR